MSGVVAIQDAGSLATMDRYSAETPHQKWPGWDGGETRWDWGGMSVKGMADQPDWEAMQNPRLFAKTKPCGKCGMPVRSQSETCEPCRNKLTAQRGRIYEKKRRIVR